MKRIKVDIEIVFAFVGRVVAVADSSLIGRTS